MLYMGYKFIIHFIGNEIYGQKILIDNEMSLKPVILTHNVIMYA